jgi:hypothetical protein
MNKADYSETILGGSLGCGIGGLLNPNLPKAHEDNFIQSIMMGVNVPPQVQ